MCRVRMGHMVRDGAVLSISVMRARIIQKPAQPQSAAWSWSLYEGQIIQELRASLAVTGTVLGRTRALAGRAKGS